VVEPRVRNDYSLESVKFWEVVRHHPIWLNGPILVCQ
jgi:hypothetical protein